MNNERKSKILEYLQVETATSSQITNYLKSKFSGKNSRITIIRDLNQLILEKKVIRVGTGPAAKYQLSKESSIQEYFKVDPDKRILKTDRFNFKIWKLLDILTAKELQQLSKINKSYQVRKKVLSSTILKKELERLTIEFIWKSSKIEGNTYTLLDTERLLRDQIAATGKKREDTIMIINHKKALDYVYAKPKYFKKLTLSKIEKIHKLLIAELGVNSGIRKGIVGIIGTRYRPLDNYFQIKEAMLKLVNFINCTKNPLAKALTAILMISYIQPFEDGNKRTARLLANAILLAYDYCPLSFRSIDETNYKEAVLLFYEQNDSSYFKDIFIDQFKHAVTTYF